MIQTIAILIMLTVIFSGYWKTTGKQVNIGSYLLLIYILSLLSSLILNTEDKSYTFEASFYFLGILLLFLIPILKFNSNNIRLIKPVDVRLFNSISYVFIFLGLATYAFFLPVIIKLFGLGGSIIGLRGDVAGGQVFYDINVIYYILTFYCQFYPIVLVFYFYSVAFTSNGKCFNGLLLFSSTGYIINVLSGIGRDGFVLWPMSYIFAYILFRKFLNGRERSKARHLIFYLLGLFLLIFIPITISRFSQGDDRFSAILSIFDYLGQQFGNFNNFYNVITIRGNDFSEIFPILNLLNQDKQSLTVMEKYLYNLALHGYDLNVFSTFIGNFMMNMDKMLLFGISAFYCLILYLLFLNNKVISFGKIILIVLISQIPLHGLFYYKLMHIVSNIYMILVILLSLLFSKRVVRRS